MFLHLDWLEGACIHPSSFLVTFSFVYFSSRLETIYPFLLWNQMVCFFLLAVAYVLVSSDSIIYTSGKVYKTPLGNCFLFFYFLFIPFLFDTQLCSCHIAFLFLFLFFL